MKSPTESETLRQIANDLNRCDILNALGTKSQKAKAFKHRKKCFQHIKKLNERDGMNDITDEELIRQLTA